MRNDIKDVLEADPEIARVEMLGSTPAVAGQEAVTEEWDFWESEYWIVRDRPPYRV